MQTHSTSIQIVEDAKTMAWVAAEIVIQTLSAAVAARGGATIALSGGSTPKGLFELLAGDPGLWRRMPWQAIHFFWGDERHVPPDHPDSNFRMAHETLLARVPVPKEHVHRVLGETADPFQAAADYEVQLRRVLRVPAGRFPRFDLTLQGMGTDGHTASLFPHSTALAEKERLATANRVEILDAWRITMTVPVFTHAAQILFLVSGAEKANALQAVLTPEGNAEHWPARLIRPVDGKLLWLVDRAAAGKIGEALGAV